MHWFTVISSLHGPPEVLYKKLLRFSQPATCNGGPDTVLSFWKRTEDYYSQCAWSIADYYPTAMVHIYNSHSLGACHSGLSLARIVGLNLPYAPNLPELFQRLGSSTIHPVLYYFLAGASSH